MKAKRFLSILAASLIASPGLAMAQGEGKQPPAKQTAPSESTDTPGHDAQTGKPETGVKNAKDPAKKSSKGDQKTGRTTPKVVAREFALVLVDITNEPVTYVSWYGP